MPSRDPPLPAPSSSKPNLDLTATQLEDSTLRLAQAFHDCLNPTSIDTIKSLSAKTVETYCSEEGAEEFIPNSTGMPIEEYILHLQTYSKRFPDWAVTIHPPKAEVDEGCRSAAVWLTLMANSSVVERGGVKIEGIYKMFWRFQGRGGEGRWVWWRYEHLDGVAGYLF